MPKTIQEILTQIPEFLKKMFHALNHDRIDVAAYELDHICYRVESTERYEELKKQLLQQGTLLGETPINGRPIATYKLIKPATFKERTIPCIELPAPKQNTFYPEGFEHAEFVIPESFADFAQKHAGVPFDITGTTRTINPEITRKYNGFSVKFHYNTLEYVIKYLQ